MTPHTALANQSYALGTLNLHCTMCILYSIFNSQPNKLRPSYRKICILIYLLTYIFAPACSLARWIYLFECLWNQTLNLGNSPCFWCHITLEPSKKRLIWYFRKQNHGQSTTFIKGSSSDSKKSQKIGYTGDLYFKMSPLGTGGLTWFNAKSSCWS